ncbi:SdpI family protein [Microbacterium sp. SLBN-146]|uniref:SdpI family protein n=1 Tax=Microbacterium sp. SLBN-146 TaxID=2768457 RepID=UPI00114FA551|nr:SdpI family protein [Microbacterium sp. SLBN-146]TQJ29884.1 SdpI/YhfL family protein [Microbacterium sp. SLBN-146]
MLIAVSTAVPLLVAGVVFLWIASRARRRTLPMNAWVGIRTTSTLRSDAAWRRGHAAAALPLAVGSVGLLVAAGGAVLAGDESAIVAALIGCAWLVAWLMVSSAAAAQAANATGEDAAPR